MHSCSVIHFDSHLGESFGNMTLRPCSRYGRHRAAPADACAYLSLMQSAHSSRIVSATEQPLVPWRRTARYARQLLLLRIQGGPARARQRQHRMSSAVLRHRAWKLIPRTQHVGIRSPIDTWGRYDQDYETGFVISHAYDIEEVGWKGIVKHIRDTVGDNPVYSASSPSPLEVLWSPSSRGC